MTVEKAERSVRWLSHCVCSEEAYGRGSSARLSHLRAVLSDSLSL